MAARKRAGGTCKEVREQGASGSLVLRLQPSETRAAKRLCSGEEEGVYIFSGGIVSRSDFTEKDKKGLDAIRRGDERTTVILNDTVAVWAKHLGNLVPMPAYHFAHPRRQRGFTRRSLAELREDEDEATGALALTLDLLRQVHSTFFEPSGSESDFLASRDVREILKDAMPRVFSDRSGGSGRAL